LNIRTLSREPRANFRAPWSNTSVRRFLLLILLLLGIPSLAGAQTTPPNDGITKVLRQLEHVLEARDSAAYLAMLAPGVSDQTRDQFLADWVVPGITRAVVHERLRAPSQNVAAGAGYDLYVDVLAEFGRRGRVGTWLVELRRAGPAGDNWRISGLAVLTTMRGLYRLELNRNKEFIVENLKLSAEDFDVRLPQGVAFVAETEGGTTGIVLIGKGNLIFSPAPEAERGQVKIFCGAEQLQTRFEWLYVRVNPVEFEEYIAPASLKPRPIDKRDLKRADPIFQENLNLSFGLDLGDLSREKWSVEPKTGDLVTEIQTDKAHLTYMRSASDPEDIRFFDRTRQRTISIYASKQKLASRGPFYSEDDQTEYHILHYNIDASFDPQREWIDGHARVYLVARRAPLSTLILTLAEPLVIRSIVSPRFGYLMALRVTGQNDVIINLPEQLPADTVLDLDITYGGRLHAVPPEREALELAQDREQSNEFFAIPTEPSYIYTGRSGWYPQGQVTDYATANLVLRVPENYSSVATGALDQGFPKLIPNAAKDARGWKEYHFSATQPVRYIAWAISRFVHVDNAVVSVTPSDSELNSSLGGVSYNAADLSVESSSMLKRRALDLSETTQDVLKFYAGLMGDIPYQSFTLAVVERSTPGGHSPPYFAALSQPPPATPIVWRTDPTYFNEFPEFFVAHEAAHQWWGQAVGWKNYHEQWLSEGFAQYFAALYAERSHRKGVFGRVISQMTRWTIDKSDQGPIYLGYRLGHLKNDSRIFRAVVYNKGAIVLHMLRRLVGDEVFFRGLQRYYSTWRFKKAGTEDLKAAFEAESHRSLDRFFNRWIYSATLPRLKFSYKIEPGEVVVRFEQVGDVFDVPVTVTVENASGTSDIIVPLTERVTEQRIPVTGVVKDVEANRDNAAPVLFVK
jgi:peptidase M1-like protein